MEILKLSECPKELKDAFAVSYGVYSVKASQTG